MTRALVLILTVSLAGCASSQPRTDALHGFERMQLSDTFYAEGAGIGDLNRDDVRDVAAGPYWYEGPDYETRHEIYPPKPFDPLNYSDNFVVEIHDADGDGWNDILVVGFPGVEAFWYRNPGGSEGHWARHLIHPAVDNESPAFFDITGDGRPELVFHTEGYVGYAEADWEHPTEPWTFRRVSEKQDLGKFTHGFGVGDVSGDGMPDILMAKGWWENTGDSLWTRHPFDFGQGGAQMYAYDVDGDGRNDVVTSLWAHGWGLAWFKQLPNGGFERNLIMGEQVEDNPYGVRFSQPHAVALADIDRDGLKDVVTGKRYWAHGPTGDPEPNAPAVIYWFRLVRPEAGSVSFVPYRIDDDSGVGVFFPIEDLTGDGFPDLAISNKKGTFVFHHTIESVSRAAWEAAQPKLLNR